MAVNKKKDWAIRFGILGVFVLVGAAIISFISYYDQDQTIPSDKANDSNQADELASDELQDSSASNTSNKATTKTSLQDQVSNLPLSVSKVIIPPSFDIVRISREGDTVIAGQGSLGSLITIYDSDEVLGTVPTDSHGEWIFIPTKPLAPGSHQLSLKATHKDTNGIISENVSQNIAVLVIPESQNTTQHAKSNNTPPTDNSSNLLPVEMLAVTVSRDGNGQTEILQKPHLESSAKDEAGLSETQKVDLTLTLSNVDYTDDQQNRIILRGTGRTGSKIQIYLDEKLVGDVIVGQGNQWSLVIESFIEPGQYQLRLDQLDNLQVVARVEFPFERSDPKLIKQQLGPKNIVVQPGNSLWRIARRTLGDGINYHVIYQANKSQIRDPDLIYPGQVFTIPQEESIPQ